MTTNCNCSCQRVCSIQAKFGDLINIRFSDSNKDFNNDDGLTEKMRIGDGDYLYFKFCMDCGQLQGIKFPLKQLEEETEQEDCEHEWSKNDERYCIKCGCNYG